MSEHSAVDFLHEVGSRIAASDPLHEVLDRIVNFIADLMQCDSSFIYILEDNELVLRASQNPHADVVDRLRLPVGQGITGWVSEHREPVALARDACQDPRFKFFSELPEDCYEAFLSVPILFRGRVVGVINVQHRLPHSYTPREIKLISTVAFLVGAEIEAARLDSEISQLSDQLATRKVVERAKGILQRDMRLTEEQSYLALQRQSRQKRKPMKEVAEAIILAADMRRDNEGDRSRID